MRLAAQRLLNASRQSLYEGPGLGRPAPASGRNTWSKPMFRFAVRIGCALAVLGVVAASEAQAQVTVTLPDTSLTTTLTATVSPQARVTVPAGVTFNVTDTSVATAATGASVSVANIVTASAASQLQLSLQADAANFTPPVAGTTYAATDVSWAAGSWTNASGSAGTLSSAVYNTVSTCTADVSSCSTTGLVFTLGANAAVNRSGNHTLVIRWRVAAI